MMIDTEKGFRFKPGDKVQMKLDRRLIGMVLYQHIDLCITHAPQFLYTIRPNNTNLIRGDTGTGTTIKIAEFEVEAYEPTPTASG